MKQHRTADGTHMYISEMSNEHLKNTINMFLEQLRQASKALNQSTVKSINTALYKEIIVSPEKAEKIINSVINDKLPHYLMEAVLRGFDYTKELQEVFERKEALTLTTGYKRNYLLPSSDMDFPDLSNDD